MNDLSQPETAVETGKSALGSGWSYPWYDRAADSLRRVEVRPERDWDWLEGWFDWLPDWDLSQPLALLGWLSIAAVLAFIAYALIRIYLERELGRRQAEGTVGPDSAAASIDRVSALPLSVRNPHADFLAEARRHYQAGNFAEAIVYLFSYQLIELDRHHLLRLTKGKTNRQYLREVRRTPQPAGNPLANLLQRTMLLFEEAFFGHRTPTRTAFESCWNRVDEFQSLLTLATEEQPRT